MSYVFKFLISFSLLHGAIVLLRSMEEMMYKRLSKVLFFESRGIDARHGLSNIENCMEWHLLYLRIHFPETC